MIVKDRIRLTKQCLRTFIQNSKLDWTLTIVDDDSNYLTRGVIDGVVGADIAKDWYILGMECVK